MWELRISLNYVKLIHCKNKFPNIGTLSYREFHEIFLSIRKLFWQVLVNYYYAKCCLPVSFTICSAMGENMSSSLSACLQEGEEASGEGAPLHIQGWINHRYGRLAQGISIVFICSSQGSSPLSGDRDLSEDYSIESKELKISLSGSGCVSQGAESLLALSVAKTGRNNLNEEITSLLPTGIGERCSQTISNSELAALLRRCELPL